MTKQQQQKVDKVNKALELMRDGRTIKDVYLEVGYSRWDKLKRALVELGYIEVEGSWISSNTDCNTSGNTGGMEIVETHKQAIIEPGQLQFVELLAQEQDTLKSMIEWYKRYSNTDNTSNTFIKIELPQSENVMISTRSNQVVWEQFKIFAKNNSANFKMGDLVAQALLDYMKKYQ